jgi:N-carbamoyl-L-amino-acid hydrolase
VNRPTLSEAHLRSLEWVVSRLPEAGLSGGIDGIGNVIGTSTRSGPKLLLGSHLESQNYAGWFDGAIGVVYALEAARVLNLDPSVRGAVEIATWCDEECHFAWFPGSRSFVGELKEAEIDAGRNRAGTPLRQALSAAGLAARPRATIEPGRYVGCLEAHTDQGGTLEAEGMSIGVATSIGGMWQYRVTFVGEENHTGYTRMANRKDAGLAMVRFLAALDDRFSKNCGPATVWTTDRIALEPNVGGVIPGRAEIVLNMRDDDEKVLERLNGTITAIAEELNAEGPCRVIVQRLRNGQPTMASEAFQNAIEAASREFAGGKCSRFTSRAGHDVQVLAPFMPVGMMYVPSLPGFSHRPGDQSSDNTSDEAIITGAQVFVDTCRKLLGKHATS